MLCELGVIAKDRCDYPTAEQYFQRAVTIAEPCQSEPDENIQQLCLRAWSDLGRLQRIQNRYEQARQTCEQVLGYAEQKFGMESPEVADALNNLGMPGKFAGWFDEARGHYDGALAILEKNHGSDPVQAASLYHNLGGLEHARERCAAGEPYARKSVELRLRGCGDENHPLVASDLAALAALLDGQEKYDEAEKVYIRVIEIFTQLYGSEHYEIAVNLNNLAAICAARGDSTQAETLYRCALTIKEKIFAPDNVEIAMTLHNLAVLYKAEERYAEAAPMFARALEIFTARLEPEHPHVVACLENYEELRRLSGLG